MFDNLKVHGDYWPDSPHVCAQCGCPHWYGFYKVIEFMGPTLVDEKSQHVEGGWECREIVRLKSEVNAMKSILEETQCISATVTN